jgi:hypothetical protein
MNGVTGLEILLLKDGRLKIALTKHESDRLPVDLDCLDLSDTQARRLLKALLEQGKAETGFSPKDSKLFMEIYPDNSGGYALYFTALNQKAGSRNDIPWIKPAVFVFANADDLCKGCAELAKLYGHRIIRSSIYHYKGEYALVFYPLDYSDCLSSYLLSEYARKAGDGEIFAAHVEEYGHPIAEGNAIEIMALHFGGKSDAPITG